VGRKWVVVWTVAMVVWVRVGIHGWRGKIFCSIKIVFLVGRLKCVIALKKELQEIT